MNGSLLQAISDLTPEHGNLAKQLSAEWGEEIFPCDALAFAILNRSLDVSRGFVLAANELLYSSCACLLRVQLDSVIRFHGLLRSNDPHGIANQVLQGIPLRKIKGMDGKPMTDVHLLDLLAASNPWVKETYETACAHVHLSEQHFYAFLQRSPADASGIRNFMISASASHLDEVHHRNIANQFLQITLAVLKVVRSWSKVRPYCTGESARQRFPSSRDRKGVRFTFR